MSKLDYLIMLASREVNCNIFYNSNDLKKYLRRCYDTFEKVEILNIFDKETLETYFYFLNELWYLLTDVVPVKYDIGNVGNDVSRKTFENQLSNLDYNELFVLFFQLDKNNMYKFTDNDDLFSFTMSALKTLKLI